MRFRAPKISSLMLGRKPYLILRTLSRMDFTKPETVLKLENIRDALVRMEDTIVFDLIERSEFYHSPSVYKEDYFQIPNFKGTFLQWILLQTEKTHSQVRRYQAPDETAFFPQDLLPSFLPPIDYPRILASYSDQINVNNEIMDFYVQLIVPRISCQEGEQRENLGSVTVCDISCLQAISRRIHFGKFVAEAKYQADKAKYIKYIKAHDARSIEDSITNAAVEAKILERLVKKGKTYGTDPSLLYSQNPQSKVEPSVIADIYKDYIIPLTRKVEVDYLLRRLEDEPEEELAKYT